MARQPDRPGVRSQRLARLWRRRLRRRKPKHMELELTAVSDGIRLAVFAKPRASRSRILGVREGALEVAIAAPPVDGAANAELLKTLARALGLPKRQLSLAAGEASKHKRVVVHGLSADELHGRLSGILG